MPEPSLASAAAYAASPTPKPTAAAVQTAAPGRASHARNLYDETLVRDQNPDKTACTAASTLIMLNFIAAARSGGREFRWDATTAKESQDAILGWERSHDTLLEDLPGSDAHGWRNALNFYGWNDFKSSATFHYQDFAYSSYEAAVRAAVMSMARYDKPVAILGWAGAHAQILNGYEVYGLDPATSSDFSVTALYLTDPLAKNHLRNARLTNEDFRNGDRKFRFRAYSQTDSPYDDAYTAGRVASDSEWAGRFVIVAPVR